MLEIANLELDKNDKGKNILLLNIQAPFPGAFFYHQGSNNGFQAAAWVI